MKVAFTGHRDYSELTTSRLRDVIEAMYEEGYHTFLSGMAEGFDIAAAEVVLELKRRGCDVKLHCIVPFRGHRRCMPNKEWSMRYQDIINNADQVIILSESYVPNTFKERNDYLVASADAMICYYSGKSRSGTGYTVRLALKKGIRTINIYTITEQILFFG